MKICTALLVTTLLALPLAAAQPPAMLGNWSLNVAKSKFDPGPPPQSETRSYQMNGDSITLTEQVVAADGQTPSAAIRTWTPSARGLSADGRRGVSRCAAERSSDT